MKRKPRLTDRVLDGIIAMGTVVDAAGPLEFFGADDKEARQDFDKAIAAIEWALNMVQWKWSRMEKKP